MRARGEGSVYRRKDGRFCASIRYTDDGGRSRRAAAYGGTEKEAKQHLREMLRRLEDGQTPKDATIPLRQWTERWLLATSCVTSRNDTGHLRIAPQDACAAGPR